MEMGDALDVSHTAGGAGASQGPNPHAAGFGGPGPGVVSSYAWFPGPSI